MPNAFRGHAIGHLGRDPELRDAGSTQVASASLAVKTGYGEREATVWIKVQCWGKSASRFAEWCRKGQLVYVAGRLSENTWTGQDGIEKRQIQMDCDDFQPLQRRESVQDGQTQPAPHQPTDRHGNQRSNAQNGAEQAREYANLAGDGGGVASAAAKQEFDDDIPF